jgi:methylated-DNA-[protein]-cysteine S-methyltransferase
MRQLSTANRTESDLAPAPAGPWQVAIFPSELGWFGLTGHRLSVCGLTFGHATPGEVQEHLLATEAVVGLDAPVDWYPELRVRLQRYAAGESEDFADVSVADGRSTRFCRRVVEKLRQVGYGEVVSYAELARRAGSPAAARAVGRVMATNPLPVIIPCHRVIGSGGRLGGYSAPSGLKMKQRLLSLERAAVPASCTLESC